MIKHIGNYFEDFELNQVYVTRGRTIIESDIHGFASLTGDWSELHTNTVYAKKTPFKKPIAHGVLSLSIATGLATTHGFLTDTIVAFEGIDKWEFKRPVYVGDTITMEMTVKKLETRKLMDGPTVGVIELQMEIKNQQGRVTQSGLWSLLIKLKPKEAVPTDAS